MRLLCATGLVLAIVLTGCSEAPTQKAEAPPKKAPKKHAPPADDRHHLPKANQVDAKIVDDYMLGKEFLPGGSLGTYKKGNTEYQIFLVKSTASDAPLHLLAFMRQMTDSKLIPHFGGYFGQDNGKPAFLFSKGAWLAGIVGLPEKEADLIARDVAARLD